MNNAINEKFDNITDEIHFLIDKVDSREFNSEDICESLRELEQLIFQLQRGLA
jgi:hypothetical protein